MSGGSMDYAYSKVESMAHSFVVSTPERRALKEHLLKLAGALRAVEWNDSGDGADDENELIRECLAPGLVLTQLLAEARSLIARLQEERLRHPSPNQKRGE